MGSRWAVGASWRWLARCGWRARGVGWGSRGGSGGGGLVPGYGGTQRLPRLVGQAAALKLLLTGEMIGSAEALRIGLVDEVVLAERLMARGLGLAQMIVAVAP